MDEKSIEKFISKIKELEAERDGFRNGQMQLQETVDTLMDSNKKWAEKVKDLEAALKINASMLAHQCIIAREAEIKMMELEKRFKDLQVSDKELNKFNLRD